MIKVNIELNDDLLQQIQSQLYGFIGNNGKQILPATKYAFDQCTALIQKSWQNWAMGGSIVGAEDIKTPSPRLKSSIRKKYSSDFNAEIYTNSKQMEQIEKGQAAYDIYMKAPNSPWLMSRKTRIVKRGEHKGFPYLIIPFQWGTRNKKGEARAHFSLANTIDQKSYAVLKSKSFSRKVGNGHFEKNRYREDILRNNYEWGGRLDKTETDNPNEVGMVRMVDEAGRKKNKPTGKYFTFRIISAYSKAEWRIKKDAIPPNHVVEALKNSLRIQINDMLKEGLRSDIGIG